MSIVYADAGTNLLIIQRIPKWTPILTLKHTHTHTLPNVGSTELNTVDALLYSLSPVSPQRIHTQSPKITVRDLHVRIIIIRIVWHHTLGATHGRHNATSRFWLGSFSLKSLWYWLACACCARHWHWHNDEKDSRPATRGEPFQMVGAVGWCAAVWTFISYSSHTRNDLHAHTHYTHTTHSSTLLCLHNGYL